MKYLFTRSALVPLAIACSFMSTQLESQATPPWPAVVQLADSSSSVTVVQMIYYAKPGKEQDVLDVRTQACAVLEKMGVNRGRILTRINSARTMHSGDIPTVTWLGEFADANSLAAYEEVAEKNEDFIAMKMKMSTLTTKVERHYWQGRH